MAFGDTYTIKDIEDGITSLWIAKLIKEWHNINWDLEEKMRRNKVLTVPAFKIGTAMKRWGQWDSEKKIIEISLRLLRGYDWKAVREVLKHEMAHQLVSEYFDISGKPHGEAFTLACELIGVDNRRCVSSEILAGMNGEDEEIVSKVKKLLAKGSNEAVTKEEGETFLKKAQELMIRYNIEVAELTNSGQFFVRRPVTPSIHRWLDFLYGIGNLVREFYNVQYIRARDSEGGSHLEFYGEPANVDVAEYIAHVFIYQGNILYEDYKKDLQNKDKMAKKFNRPKEYRPKISRASFMQGLVDGYWEKLSTQRQSVFSSQKVESCGKTGQEIIIANSKILREHFEKEYNPRTGHRSQSCGGGYHSGQKAGASLTINAGISRGNVGKFLN